MKKSNLKTGMIVETRDGRKALVVLDNVCEEDGIIFSEDSWTGLEAFSENLVWHAEYDNRDSAIAVDIMKIYKPDLPTGFLSKASKFRSEMILLWERTPEKIIEFDGVEYSESTLRSIIKKATE